MTIKPIGLTIWFIKTRKNQGLLVTTLCRSPRCILAHMEIIWMQTNTVCVRLLLLWIPKRDFRSNPGWNWYPYRGFKRWLWKTGSWHSGRDTAIVQITRWESEFDAGGDNIAQLIGACLSSHAKRETTLRIADLVGCEGIRSVQLAEAFHDSPSAEVDDAVIQDHQKTFSVTWVSLLQPSRRFFLRRELG